MRWNDWPLSAKLVLLTTALVVLAVVGVTVLIMRAGRETLRAEVSTVRNMGLVVALAAAIVGVAVALLLARSVTRSLGEIDTAMKEIASGDLSRQIPVRGRDEFSQLARSFNEMTVALRQTAAFKGAILETIYEGIVIVDHTGQILEFNPAAEVMFGYRHSEAVKLRMTDLIPQQTIQPRRRQRITHYLDNGEGSLFGQMIEARARRSDDSDFPIEWAITRISATEPPKFTVVVHDLTRRKAAEEELRQAKEAAESANRAKSTFLANMSHELRTPLSVIIGYSELLQEDAAERGYSSLLPDIERILTAGNHLLVLISGILNLSKIEAGKLELRLDTFDLAMLVDEVAVTGQSLAMRRGNTFQVQCPRDIGTMHADRVKVQQILLNLLSNAAKFTEQGEISLSVAREIVDGASWMCFQVVDSGIGMTSEQVEQLFQPFIQFSTTVGQESVGSGLGLAISRSFCRLMGGEVAVESELNQGTRFTVRIPAVVEPVTWEEGLAGQ